MLLGCGANNSGTTQDQPIERVEGPSRRVKSTDGTFDGQITGVPARGSKFSKLQIGMPMKQVTDLIGEPNDISAGVTGKAFIPFYFGNDSTRMKTFYRGEGYLIFNPQSWAGSSYRLIGIHVDPKDTGYAR